MTTSSADARANTEPGIVPIAGLRPPPFGFPIQLEVRGRRVLVAGAGREAAHKAAALAELGARVVVWARRHDRTASLAGTPGIELAAGDFDPGLLEGALIAIVAEEDRELGREIARAARARGVLVNTVDDLDHCDWSAPAILRRGELTIAVATGGAAPAVGVRLRDRIADELAGPEYEPFVDLLRAVRPRILGSGRSFGERRVLWYGLVDGPALGLLRAGDPDAAGATIEAAIAAWEAEA
jgi:precorrin-2 dehydrogenase/sirohydrochlorin ferrochelatase